MERSGLHHGREGGEKQWSWGKGRVMGKDRECQCQLALSPMHIYSSALQIYGVESHTFKAGLLTLLIFSAINHGHTTMYFVKCPSTSQFS